MILSMTGFGRGTAVRNGREITVELRSVNSRYFEYSSRIPRTCSYLDSRLKKQLNERITRGKVELSMTIQNVDAADTGVTVNMELARSYQQAMRDLSEQLGVKNDISAAVLTRFPDVLATRHADVDEETVRLRSHISQYRGILQLNEPVGRKLDFLTQELNRETNTIGSKCQDLDITRIVVDMKAEIEKIREQIQNLE